MSTPDVPLAMASLSFPSGVPDHDVQPRPGRHHGARALANLAIGQWTVNVLAMAYIAWTLWPSGLAT